MKKKKEEADFLKTRRRPTGLEHTMANANFTWLGHSLGRQLDGSLSGMN